MTDQIDTIQVDKSTADALRTRAAERGISVAQLLAEIASESGPVTAEAADLAELDRRWAKVKAGEVTVPHDDVVRWLDTWGTEAFRPLRER
jgi:predicted transcriptional regulator